MLSYFLSKQRLSAVSWSTTPRKLDDDGLQRNTLVPDIL